MQILAGYRERAANFEQLAAEESIPEIKALFERQAARHRDLAEHRERFLRGVFPEIAN
jgi:hypothetical protein